MPQAFSSEWAGAWCDLLNASETFRTSAATWEGSVALVAGSVGDPLAAVFLDLWRGSCREARAATAGDLAQAAFVLEAEPATWRLLLSGASSPVNALLTGRLRLTRGSLASLLPQAGTARELLLAADRIETTFPAGW